MSIDVWTLFYCLLCTVCFIVCCNPAFLAAKSNKGYYYYYYYYKILHRLIGLSARGLVNVVSSRLTLVLSPADLYAIAITDISHKHIQEAAENCSV